MPEIYRYWRKVGGALLDRVDLRVPLSPVPTAHMSQPKDPSETPKAKQVVLRAIHVQRQRFAGLGFSCNARIPPGLIERYCELDQACSQLLAQSARTADLSSRAYHSILRMARTIADLDGRERIGEKQVQEAVQYRRYGDSDFYWKK
jgi:magnesium chelatase family protein